MISRLPRGSRFRPEISQQLPVGRLWQIPSSPGRAQLAGACRIQRDRIYELLAVNCLEKSCFLVMSIQACLFKHKTKDPVKDYFSDPNILSAEWKTGCQQLSTVGTNNAVPGALSYISLSRNLFYHNRKILDCFFSLWSDMRALLGCHKRTPRSGE